MPLYEVYYARVVAQTQYTAITIRAKSPEQAKLLAEARLAKLDKKKTSEWANDERVEPDIIVDAEYDEIFDANTGLAVD